jgi:hypothetical protein
MPTIKITKRAKGSFEVIKHGAVVAYISRVLATDPGNWTEQDHWALRHASGRVDRHETLNDARSDALKM